MAQQDIQLREARLQALVDQEKAIAYRIESSEFVEIEEFYEGTGEGNVGVNTAARILNIGIGGKGSRVIRRVIRFKNRTR